MSDSQSFTKMNLTVHDKSLNGEISRSGVEPLNFSTKFPAFHVPGKLIIQFETTDSIFSKNITLENSLHSVIKLLLSEYKEQLKSWVK